MQCENCNQTITSKMKGAIASNSCPFCADPIMDQQKAEQYSNLLEVLDQTSFTNKAEFDEKIREKFAALMLTNFIFMKVDNQDLVILETSEPELIEEENTTVALPKKVRKAKKAKAKTKVVKKVNTKKANAKKATDLPTQVKQFDSQGRPMNQHLNQDLSSVEPRGISARSVEDYDQIQDQMYSGVESEQGSPLSNLAAPQPGSALEKDLQLAAKYLKPKKGIEGTGIRRK